MIRIPPELVDPNPADCGVAVNVMVREDPEDEDEEDEDDDEEGEEDGNSDGYSE
jgi:hypothetical protein